MARSAQQNCSYLYIVHEREFIRHHIEVYKVGYTSNLSQRMCQYPKGSIALMMVAVPRSKAQTAEAMLLAACRKAAQLKQRRDIGAEYFEGPIAVIMELVCMAAAGLLQYVGQDMPGSPQPGPGQKAAVVAAQSTLPLEQPKSVTHTSKSVKRYQCTRCLYTSHHMALVRHLARKKQCRAACPWPFDKPPEMIVVYVRDKIEEY